MPDKLYEFRIPCEWMQTANIYVEAKNLEEAIEKAHEADFPEGGEYCDDSFQINEDWAEEVNRDVIKQIEKDKKPIDNIVEQAFPNGIPKQTI